jgi:hypothetical protein
MLAVNKDSKKVFLSNAFKNIKNWPTWRYFPTEGQSLLALPWQIKI